MPVRALLGLSYSAVRRIARTGARSLWGMAVILVGFASPFNLFIDYNVALWCLSTFVVSVNFFMAKVELFGS